MVYLPTTALFLAVSVFLILGGSSLQKGLAQILNTITSQMGWAYMAIYIINFLFFMYLAFGRFGKVRLGKPNEKPEYSTYQWGSMVFATGIDASILMLGMVDPLRYVQTSQYGAKAFSTNAYNYANIFGQFNWGPMAWMMFAPATIAIAYALYVKHIKIQRLSGVISVLQGPGLLKATLRNLIDLLVVIGIMGGVGSSVGMEIPVIARVLSSITGVADTMNLKLGLFLLLFVIFALTVYRGLNGGIDKLSAAHVWLAVGFLVIVLLVGPTLYLLNAETSSLGLLVQKFVSLATNTAANGHAGVVQHETIFYWGWWLSYMPVMGLFFARISRGRTIKQVIVGMLTWGALGCMSFYAILGGYALYIQKMGIVDLVHILNTQGQAAVIAAVLSTLPLKMIMLVIYCLSCFIFLATTISSSAFIVSSFTSTDLKLGEQPSRFNRMSWVVIFILFSLGIVIVGGFQTVETVSTIAGFPLILVCAVLLGSIYRNLSGKPVLQFKWHRKTAKVTKEAPAYHANEKQSIGASETN